MAAQDALWTIKSIVQWSTQYLKDHGSPSPRLDAEILLASVLGCERISLYVNFDKPLSAEEKALFKTQLKRRASGEPVAYITGYREFYGHRFIVSPAVLIPRPETEHLVEYALKILENNACARVLDVGTGSACIPISLKKHLPELYVEAWDICEKALKIAESNANSLDCAISFKQVDAMEHSSWKGVGAFDMVCSNPPYISFSEKEDLPKSVRDYEPAKALFADENGLAFYRMISSFAAAALKPSGDLLLEIGSSQGVAVKQILVDDGWQDVAIQNDLAGLNRLVTCKKLAL